MHHDGCIFMFVLLMLWSQSVLAHFEPAHKKYLWFLVYLWVHLRAEEGEKNHEVPPSEVVLLSAGHAQCLVLNHLSSDHYGSGESQGLTQNAICRRKCTAERVMSEGCRRELNQLRPRA